MNYKIIPVDKFKKEVYLLTIYDKAEFDSIDDKTIRRIVAIIPTEK